MGALGLSFGTINIIVITLIAFLVGAVISIIAIVYGKIRKNNKLEYIPFGPFIVSAVIIDIFIPFQVLFNIMLEIFSLGMAH